MAFSRVWITQWSARDQYRVGDSAVLQCNISTQGETLRRCKITWVILNPSNRKRTLDIQTVEKYQRRVRITSHGTFSEITLHSLSANDTEPLFCTTTCFIDGTLTQIFGSGTSLRITGRLQIYIFHDFTVYIINYLVHTFTSNNF